MRIKTIIDQQPDTYTAFPTFVCHGKSVYIYYRQGMKTEQGTHGNQGRVCQIRFPIADFKRAFLGEGPSLEAIGEVEEVFAGGNEMDAIVSSLGPNQYSLATRMYDDNGVMTTYLSLNSKPLFKDRHPVNPPGTKWVAFYGKAFTQGRTMYFPAYGELDGDHGGRPLILTTKDGIEWQVKGVLPSMFDGKTILNETSILRVGSQYIAFMRQDSKPYGLWYSRSTTLVDWSTPTRFCQHAHAPMALNHRGQVYLTYRRIHENDGASASICINPLNQPQFMDLDTYQGSIYDGGYGDPGIIDDELFVFYYWGNSQGEPYLKCCRPELPPQIGP